VSQAEVPRRRVSVPRGLVHALGVIIGWLVFALFWWLVLARPWESRDLWLLIVGSLVLLPIITAIWVVHNVALFRRRGPRRSVPAVDPQFERDSLDRPLIADWSLVRTAQQVTIAHDGAAKRYSVTAQRIPAAVPAGTATAAAPSS
jgi:hypothetical protein